MRRKPYVVTYCLEKTMDISSVVFYCHSGHFTVGNKLPEVYWSADYEFYSRLEI